MTRSARRICTQATLTVKIEVEGYTGSAYTLYINITWFVGKSKRAMQERKWGIEVKSRRGVACRHHIKKVCKCVIRFPLTTNKDTVKKVSR